MTVRISCQTLQLPPPFAYAYTLSLHIESQKLTVEFHLEYLNRDTLQEEEILEEGFSPEEHFHWQGTLGNDWIKVLKRDLDRESLTDNHDPMNLYIHMEIGSRKGMVSDEDFWDFRLQEIIQAIYEGAGYERELAIKLLLLENGSKKTYELSASFRERHCQVNNQPLHWEEMQELMRELFSLESSEEFIKNPSIDGLWIDQDGQSGYQKIELTEGLRGIKAKPKILKILSKY